MDNTILAIAINHSSAGEPLTTLVNYGQLALSKVPLQTLKEGEIQDKTDETSEAFKRILSEFAFYLGNRAGAEIKVLSTWVRANFRLISEDFTEPLHYIISEGIKEAQKFKSDFEIETSIEADTELIVAGDTELILAYVLAGAYEVIPKAHLSVIQHDNRVIFTIKRTLERNIKPYNHEFILMIMQTAMILLYRLGSELKIRQEENTVIFEFALPVVESES